ncbi:helix-turn-helix domain-containing protein [Leptolyngbya sp. NIES-2104]|uniref:helix-turn-helix domain-containing protein n=1 Tax=Leptolyngbya sp. NIES-2104 TaxID=1552121 RepID=UPI0006ECB27D|nr:helix-turn-helix transcriptional regulator [Leptolyngbya sp. NIES-2104]GAQ00129.1 ferredoxin [Leptolyngbya sp. NIES-2104]
MATNDSTPETSDVLLGWEAFTELWNTDIPKVSDWIERAETCLITLLKAKDVTDVNLSSELKLCKTRLESAKPLIDGVFTLFQSLEKPPELKERSSLIAKQVESINKKITSLSRQLEEVSDSTIASAPKAGRLFRAKTFHSLPTSAPMISSLASQMRRDLWQERDGVSVFEKRSKSNPQNYIEHYISGPGDISLLPWDAAEKIINQFGFNTVRLQLLLAAHAMNLAEPWNGSFTLSGEDLLKDLGWNNRKDISLSKKLSELVNCAFALDCLLVKVEWKEGQPTKRGMEVTVETSRMWNIAISATGQKNLLTGELEDIQKAEFQIRPGAWTEKFLNRGGAKAREALYQFGYLAQNVLSIDPYHNELALRLAIHLSVESRIHQSGGYRVRTLLESVLVGYENKIIQAQRDRDKARDLMNQWNEALKTFLRIGWLIEFDESYPEILRPDSKARRPKGYLEMLLESKLTIQPSDPIPNLLSRIQASRSTRQSLPKPRSLPSASQPLTGDQVRAARKSQKWSQAKLAGLLNISQPLISQIEAGTREPTPEIEAGLRKLLSL